MSYNIESRWRREEVRYIRELMALGDGGMGQLIEDANQYIAQRTESGPVDPEKVQQVYSSIIEDLQQSG